MQGTNSRAGKSKRPKLAANKPKANASATSESPPNRPTVEKLVINKPTISKSLITKPLVNDFNKTNALRTLVNDTHCLYANEILLQSSINTIKYSDETIRQQIEGDLHTISHNNGIAILDKYFLNSPVNLGHVDNVLALNILLR
jgi:hypothetical protein